VHHRFFPKIYPVACLSACSSVCLSLTENAYTHNTHNAYNSPWSGPVDGVIWRAAPGCFVLFSSFVRDCFKGEREGGAVFVRSPSSIEYRYSPSPSPSSVFLLFFFFKKISVGSFLALRHHICLLFLSLSLFLSFASPRLSIHSLLPAKRPYVLVVTYPYRIVPYRTILQYPRLLRLTD